MATDDRDTDPLAPLVAALILLTLAAIAVMFVLLVGGGVEAASVWHVVVLVGPWYVGLGGTLVVARYLGRRGRRRD